MLPPSERVMKHNRDWIGAGAGFLFILLSVVGLAVGGDHPSSIGPIEIIKSRFLTDPGAFAIQAASYIQAVSMLPFVVFAVRIAQRLWLGGQQWPAAVAFGGAILTAAIGLVENSLLSVLAYSVAGDGDPGAIKALYGLRHILIVYIYVPEAMTAFAIAFGSLTAGLFSRWYGWLTALVGLLLLSGAADLARSGYFRVQGNHWFYVLLVYSLWTLLTSGMLLTRQRTTQGHPDLPAT
jgi:hypothetical protein